MKKLESLKESLQYAVIVAISCLSAVWLLVTRNERRRKTKQYKDSRKTFNGHPKRLYKTPPNVGNSSRD